VSRLANWFVCSERCQEKFNKNLREKYPDLTGKIEKEQKHEEIKRMAEEKEKIKFDGVELLEADYLKFKKWQEQNFSCSCRKENPSDYDCFECYKKIFGLELVKPDRDSITKFYPFLLKQKKGDENNMSDKDKFLYMDGELKFTFDANDQKLIDNLTNLFLTRVKKYDHMYLPDKYDEPNDTPIYIAEYMAHFVIKTLIEHSE
jgi:hypothetical protein